MPVGLSTSRNAIEARSIEDRKRQDQIENGFLTSQCINMASFPPPPTNTIGMPWLGSSLQFLLQHIYPISDYLAYQIGPMLASKFTKSMGTSNRPTKFLLPNQHGQRPNSSAPHTSLSTAWLLASTMARRPSKASKLSVSPMVK